MLSWIKRLFAGRSPRYSDYPHPADAQIPRQIIGHAYCIAWQSYVSGEKRKDDPYKDIRLNDDYTELPWPPADGEVAFNHYRMGLYGRDDTGLIEGLIPAVRIGDRVGLYRVLRRYKENFWYDGLPWDDGYKVDLELVEVISIEGLRHAYGFTPEERDPAYVDAARGDE